MLHSPSFTWVVMLRGAVHTAVAQAITGQTLWRQLAAAPFAYLVAYSLVIVGALLNRFALTLLTPCDSNVLPPC